MFPFSIWIYKFLYKR